MRIPETVSSEQASLTYLAQLGLTTLRQTHYEPGERVAIVGLGVIGLCAVAVAHVLGAEVTAVANSPCRAEAARRLGVRDILTAADCSFDDSGDADVVILTADEWDAYRLAVALARHGGRVGILAFPGRAQPHPDFYPLDPRWLYAKQLTLVGTGWSPPVECGPDQIRFNLPRNLEYLLDRMADGSLSLDPLISHRFPAEQMRDAYELALSHDKSLLAAVFIWQDGSGR